MENDNNNNTNSDNKKKGEKDPKGPVNSYWIYAILIAFLFGINLVMSLVGRPEEVTFKKFEEIARAEDISKLNVVNKQDVEIFIKKEKLDKYKETSTSNKLSSMFEPPQFTMKIGSVDKFLEKIDALNEDYKLELDPKFENRQNWVNFILSWTIPILLFIGVWLFIMRRVGGGGAGPGAQLFNIGKSRATLFDSNAKVNITFNDVAGLDEAKEEIMEIVDFLKTPKKYTSLGGKIPKGVLLVGPPGTGKTLLAKAVAGEANVPFFSISGSDFVEMFVGVGASRVRDLFRQAREKAPCIVFIDEIDAIGRSRGKGAVQGANDERENTLNQLLVEMDGFSTDKGVILMAATNRPDVLDSALLSPGRFDRQIGIDRPDLKERRAIFVVHLKNIKISKDVKPSQLAEMTPGFAGADIANVCNEAALVAARRDKKAVEIDDFNYALDRVIGGLEKKNKLISPKEKEIIAYHEAGHAICGWYLEHASPLVKVTIVPRGMGTLGYAQYLPKEEYITRTEQLLDRICMTFGGRAAEKIIFDKISTGAQNDLDQVTKMAYSMIGIYGMNKKVGNVSFYGMQQDQWSKPYSDDTATLIDTEVRKLLEDQYKRSQELLKSKKKELDILAKELLEKEVLIKSDVEKLIGVRPFEDPEEYVFEDDDDIPPSDNSAETTEEPQEEIVQ
ncbi:MAG: ATP-dependent zinc metalloprotease FtsH [Saprospiraceae bacterium]|nr:ATP-dependent zinc metalloprotease FtsH [Saprospiraceae bacterium]